MGITIHYRGRLADLSRIEDFEDRVLDLVLALGGTGRIWRSYADHDSNRVMRGLILNLTPGQESTSLIISPEGWITNLFEIEAAERGELTEAPWVFVKTQFGPVEGHVALVEMFKALKQHFMPDLEVHDEGGYWETGDVRDLARKFGFLNAAIDGLAEGLRKHGLSPEAAEDPEILKERIVRVAEMVRKTLGRPSEHPPAGVGDDADEDDPAALEARWDELERHRIRMQERVHRALEERLARGESYDTAFEDAMRDAGIPVPGDNLPDGGEDDDDESPAKWEEDNWEDGHEFLEALDHENGEDDDEDESFDDDDEALDDESDDATSDAADEDDATDSSTAGPRRRRKRHPLLERATQFMLRLHHLTEEEAAEAGRESASSEAASGETAAEPVSRNVMDVLFQGAGDLCGGLAQVLQDPDEPDDLPDDPEFAAIKRGHAIVQLKRAMRGIAFAKGALYQLRGPGAPPKEVVQDLHETLEGIEDEVFQKLAEARGAGEDEA